MRRDRIFALAVGLCVLLAVGADYYAPPPLERARSVASIVTDRDGQWLHAFADREGRWRFAADIDAIDPSFVEKLIAIEDKRFFTHPGVDPAAVMRASIDWARTGRIQSGASTITMQTARLLEPRPRTLKSKLIEMVRALQIERRLTKREILEIYLTLAPYGGNIEGVHAASRLYFGKDPIALSNAEQALLIALPQAPEARRPDRNVNNAKAARAVIALKLNALGLLSDQHAQEAAVAKIPTARRALPRHAYHTARRLSDHHWPGRAHTTIDFAMQERAQSLLAAHLQESDDGATGALVIIENESGRVRASVGSSGLNVPGGWIDLTHSVRSPGSTLKPFIYAQAFEDGRAGPATVIEDMPRSFDGYAPENFDRSFRGEVRVKDALQHSLNVPAVAALERVGANRFANILRNVGIDLRMPGGPDDESGLALALGGAGVRAVDLAALYLALATDGRVRPLRWHNENPTDEIARRRIMTADNARRISKILSDAPSLAGRAPSALTQRTSPIAFKTGTSYGYRDAWAAGHGAGYTIVVWVGRADGAPRSGMTGRKAAAPLLFRSFDMVQEIHGDDRDTDDLQAEPAPTILARAPIAIAPPQIIFPQNGAELFADNAERGFALAARGGAAGYRWYVNGDPVARDSLGRRSIWTPGSPGFYDVTVVDAAGRTAKSKVRIVGAS